MSFRKILWVFLLIACVGLIGASYTLACEECVQADAGFHGCQGGHETGHSGCTPAADGSGCSVSGNCGMKSIN